MKKKKALKFDKCDCGEEIAWPTWAQDLSFSKGAEYVCLPLASVEACSKKWASKYR